VLAGLPGSGKSYLANKLQQSSGYVRVWAGLSIFFDNFQVNQDELGNRYKCEQKAKSSLDSGRSVVIDRCIHLHFIPSFYPFIYFCSSFIVFVALSFVLSFVFFFNSSR